MTPTRRHFRANKDTSSQPLTGGLESVVEVVPVAPEGRDADAGRHEDDGGLRVFRQVEVRRPSGQEMGLLSKMIKEWKYRRKQKWQGYCGLENSKVCVHKRHVYINTFFYTYFFP